MHNTLTDAIADYILSRKLAKLQAQQKHLDRANAKGVEQEQQQAQQAYDSEDAKLSEIYDPVIWLCKAAARAKQISLCTHSAKFIHSDAKSSSCLFLTYEADSDYVATSTLPHKTIDASGNAAALDVAALLKLQVNGHSLLDELHQGHVKSLWPFSSDKALHRTWLEGFSLALSKRRISSHNLAKQVYFPLEDGSYHLLMPLYASSLAQELHHKITHSRYGEGAKAVREARRNEQFYPKMDVRYPNTVVQSFGGSKAQNISQLNSKRHGKNFLLPCSPPSLQAPTPLFHCKTFFDSGFTRALWQPFSNLRCFIEKQRKLVTWQHSEQHYLQAIIDAVLQRAAHYQSLKQDAGWSEHPNCKLKTHYKLWLDTWHSKPQFQQQRAIDNWQQVISEDFASWLNKNLSKNEKFSIDNTTLKQWQKIFAKQLQQFECATPKAGALI